MDDMYNQQDGQNPQENTYRRPTVQEQLQGSSYQQNAAYQQSAGQNPYAYQQPTVQDQLQYQYQPNRDELEEPMTMGEWMISLLIMMIPCANIIMAFVWAFSDKEKKSKSNFFKAQLIFIGIYFVLFIVMFIIMGAAIGSLMNSVAYY